MVIGGIQKISLIDYPGHVAAVIFTQGCNFRCGYCHDAELVLPEQYGSTIDMAEILKFLESRQGKLDAVVVCGGEPTFHQELPEFMHKIKQMGFLVKLDSNGTNSAMIEEIINKHDVDFVAMDIKGPLWKYPTITSRPVDESEIKKSINIIIKSGIEHEFRTTVVKGILDINDFEEIGQLVKDAKRFAVQKFIPDKTLNPQFARKFAYSDSEMQSIKQIMDKYVQNCVVH